MKSLSSGCSRKIGEGDQPPPPPPPPRPPPRPPPLLAPFTCYPRDSLFQAAVVAAALGRRHCRRSGPLCRHTSSLAPPPSLHLIHHRPSSPLPPITRTQESTISRPDHPPFLPEFPLPFLPRFSPGSRRHLPSNLGLFRLSPQSQKLSTFGFTGRSTSLPSPPVVINPASIPTKDSPLSPSRFSLAHRHPHPSLPGSFPIYPSTQGRPPVRIPSDASPPFPSTPDVILLPIPPTVPSIPHDLPTPSLNPDNPDSSHIARNTHQRN